eukprot:3839694-Prymnesium_polylepis.1
MDCHAKLRHVDLRPAPPPAAASASPYAEDSVSPLPRNPCLTFSSGAAAASAAAVAHTAEAGAAA